MRGMDKMFQSITGISSEDMKQYVSDAIVILRSLDERLQNIERNCVEANERLKRLEKDRGINKPLLIVENGDKTMDGENFYAKEN